MKRLLIAIKIAAAEIYHNKLRSFLSILSISAGVLVFLFVFAVINYSNKKIAEQLEASGENGFIMRLPSGRFGLKMDKYNDMVRKFPEFDFLSPLTHEYDYDTMVDNKMYEGQVLGITPNYRKIDWAYTDLKGRFINWDDIENHRRVAVFVYQPLKNKTDRNSSCREYPCVKWNYNNKAMIGKTVSIRQHVYTVVGTVEAPLNEDDNRLEKDSADFLIPITTFSDTFWWNGGIIASLKGGVKDISQIDTATEKLKNYAMKFSESKRMTSINVRTYRDMAASSVKRLKENAHLILILGAIAMICGGIGIMNVILATMYARVKEIGTRRALGAGRADIFWQFSMESMLLSFIGSLMGLTAAFFTLDKISGLLSMEISMGFSAVLYSFVIAVATGFLFSLYPSLKAANMNPVEALRAE